MSAAVDILGETFDFIAWKLRFQSFYVRRCDGGLRVIELKGMREPRGRGDSLLDSDPVEISETQTAAPLFPFSFYLRCKFADGTSALLTRCTSSAPSLVEMGTLLHAVKGQGAKYPSTSITPELKAGRRLDEEGGPARLGGAAKTLPSEASQPYEAAIFACFKHYRLELNAEPMEIDMKREARKLVIHYFNAHVDAPHRGPFEARIAEQAIKFAVIYHVFAHIKIERRSQGIYGVEDLDEELPPLDRLAMEAGLGISQWFARCQEEFLSKKRQGDRENVYYRFHQKFSKHPFFTTRELYSAGLDVNTVEEAREYFEDWESRGLIEQLKTEEKGGPGRRKLPHYRFTIMLRGKLT
jgi:hypothetical protein